MCAELGVRECWGSSSGQALRASEWNEGSVHPVLSLDRDMRIGALRRDSERGHELGQSLDTTKGFVALTEGAGLVLQPSLLLWGSGLRGPPSLRANDVLETK